MSIRSRHLVVLAIVAAAALGGSVVAGAVSQERHGHHKAEPLIIGHRGTAGYRPEHTLASYQLAIDLGADYIEPDLVSTKDGVLVARHENAITDTTDVAQHPEFAGRRTTKVIDGVTINGWFTEDFTLAELKTLRAKERLPQIRPTNTAFDGLYEVPTFQEVIDLAKKNGVGIYPETKHPSYFDSIGLSLEEPLIRTLRANGLDRRGAKVFIQSFEVGNLKQLNGMTDLPIVQLLSSVGKPFDFVISGDPRTYADLSTAAGLREISRYADGVGPSSDQIVPINPATGASLPPTDFVRNAHAAGLVVHPYTFRRENNFLPADFRQGNPASPQYPLATGNLPGWIEKFFRLGVDGIFTDNSDVGVAVREHVFDR